jgi:release factor glutamine methyltransferase
MSTRPYLASDDSALLRSTLEGYSGSRCLEIGAGNGGNLIDLSRSFDLTVGSDLTRPGMGDWSLAGADYVLTDRAGCFRDGTFDLVVFNPPYLPSNGVDDPATDGGERGDVPLGFLREALRVVKSSGKTLMLLSEENPVDEFKAECNRRGFGLRRVATRRLFYEALTVYEASREV